MSGGPGGKLLLGAVFAARTDEDLHQAYRELRERARVLVTRVGVPVLSRYADVQAALRDRRPGKTDLPPRAYLGTPAEDQVRVWQRTVFFTNPREHTRLRRLISGEFTPQRAPGPAGSDRVLSAIPASLPGVELAGAAHRFPSPGVRRFALLPVAVGAAPDR